MGDESGGGEIAARAGELHVDEEEATISEFDDIPFAFAGVFGGAVGDFDDGGS